VHHRDEPGVLTQAYLTTGAVAAAHNRAQRTRSGALAPAVRVPTVAVARTR
jgi:hypothetical protein